MSESAEHAGGQSQPDRPRWSLIDLRELGEHELWDLFHDDAEEQAQHGEAVTLAYYLDRVPQLRGYDIALHAAICAVLENAMDLGSDRNSALDSLETDHPDLGEVIQEVRLIDDIVGKTSSLEDRLVESQIELPREFGPDWRDGQRRYQLVELLSRGSHGVVYKAKDHSLSVPNRPAWVAVKILRDSGGPDPGPALREGARARLVEHPNVARVIEAGVQECGQLYFCFEYIEGVTLDSYAGDHRHLMTPRAAVRFILPVLDGLAAAHERGIAHLDLHPRNVLVTARDKPVLIDFGLAVFIHEQSGSLRRAVGALGFVAPEVFRGDDFIDPLRADIYSAAGLVWWLLTGDIPNGRSVEHIEAKLSDITRDDPGLNEDAAAFLDSDLVAVLKRGLHPSTIARSQSLRLLIGDLQDWIDDRPIRGTHPSLLKRGVLFARRSPKTIISIGAMCLVLAVASAGVTWQQLSHKHRTVLAERESQLREARLLERAAVAEADALRIEGVRLSASRETYEALRVLVASVSNESITKDWYLALALVRDLADQEGRLDAATLAATRDARIQGAKQIVDELERSGQGDSTITLMWHAALASSLADDGRFAECVELLNGRMSQIADRFGDDEPIVLRLQILHDCAAILASHDGGQSALAESELLSQLLDRLDDIEPGTLPPRLAKLVERARK